MYIRRLRFLITNKIRPDAVATPEKANRIIPEPINYSSNNLKNLFELPVLFYAICLYLYVTQQVDTIYLLCAYGFLIFRAIHSIIQCTINIVMLRFIAYLLATVTLWIMVARAAWQLFL